MINNYTIKQLDEHTWQVEETNQRMGVYFYILEGEKTTMLIDAGLGGLDLIKVVGDVAKLPFSTISTHGHLDHVGGNPYAERVYIHEAEGEVYRANANGVGPFKPIIPIDGKYTTVADGELIDLGGRTLKIMLTPGHTPGHISVLDVERRWLYTGDCCCRGEVLLASKNGTSVEAYSKTLENILSHGDEFDTTWPAHLDSPVTKETIAEIKVIADGIAAGKLVGVERKGPFGSYLTYMDGPIGIAYYPDNLRG